MASRTSSTSCGAPSAARAATRRILSSSFIRLVRVCSRPAVSTRIGSQPRAPPRLDRVEHHGGRIGAFLGANDVDVGALRPDLQLLHGGRPERVGGADERLLARRFQVVGELADGRGLARAVHADDQRHVRDVTVCGAADAAASKIARISALTRSRRLSPSPRPLANGGDDLFGRGDADVGGDEQLLERFHGVDVDGRGAARVRVGTLNDLVESVDDLLLGAGKALDEAIEEAQLLIPPVWARRP